jgi:hypothetical protein
LTVLAEGSTAAQSTSLQPVNDDSQGQAEP